MTENKIYGTPYDDAFKTMLEKFPQLIIPIINEQFGKNYALDEKVEFFDKEIHEPEDKRIVADSIFRIGKEFYHVECQSNPDNTIAIRILEYDFFISFRNPKRNENGIYELKLPRSCVLYLRHNSETKDSMSVKVWLNEEESFVYTIPIIKVQAFTKEEIFQKNLFMLLPFYIMRYEKELEELSTNYEKMHILIAEYKGIVAKMNEAFHVKDDSEGQRLCVELQIIMKKVSEYFFRNQKNVKSQIGGVIMGGTCWKTFEEECIEKGMEKGIEKGQLQTLDSLIKDGIITEEIAAAKVNVSVEEYRKLVAEIV